MDAGRDGGQVDFGLVRGLMECGVPEEKTPSLVAHFPNPRWDEETSKIAFERLMRRLHERAALRARLTRAAVATGVAALATAGWVLL